MTKEAIPNLDKLPEGMEIKVERLESLYNIFPQYYLHMFEHMKRGNMKMNLN